MSEGPDAMPEGTDTTLEAVEQELDCARELFQAGKALESALTHAAPASLVQTAVRAQRRSMERAREAATARRQLLPDPASFRAWQARLDPDAAERAGRMRSEAQALRGDIARLAKRTEYLARRGARWYEALQGQLIASLNRTAEASPTYSASGPGVPTAANADGGRKAWILNRSA